MLPYPKVMKSGIVFTVTHFLFRYFYPVYKFLYFIFKRRQDKAEMQLMQRWVKPSAVVVDIGANIGFYSRYFSGLVGPKGMVYSFEPDAYNYRRLLETLSGYPNVVTENAAVSDTSGQLQFFLSPDKNVDHRAYATDTHTESYSVKCVSLDDFLDEETAIDFMKVDVQGYEMSVYKGAEQLLAFNSDIKILSEFWPYGLEKAGSSKEAFFDFFSTRGFHVYLLEGETLRKLSTADLPSFPINEANYYNVLICKEELAS